MAHPCSSASCSGWRKQDGNGNGGGRGGFENGGPFCYCGMKCVVRIVRTAKNRGKQFWGCPKFKNGGEDGGCNYFSWCADHGVVERETSVKREGMSESFLNRESMEGGWKIISEQMDLSVNKLGNRINVLLGMECFYCTYDAMYLGCNNEPKFSASQNWKVIKWVQIFDV
ncbi:hypothetical protein V8G54_005150 [Vigna mungo]|uniref:GRF-type domain-containing protein n=1 Tax=Vigna mungo TaxID=3915 RepID=A0AAQ3PCY1_VIGMU